MGVCTRECKGMTAGVLMATPVTIPCTKSLGGGSGENKRRPPAGRRDAGLEPRSPHDVYQPLPVPTEMFKNTARLR